MKRQLIHTFMAILASLFFVLQPQSAGAGAGTIIVSAPASMTEVIKALGEDFANTHPEIVITFNFGGSGDLLAQISQGAPVDVFISASAKHMDQAREQGLIDPASRRIFAGNTLVLAQPAGGKPLLTGLADLTKPEVARIGIGKPETVPAGQYAREALLAAGIWDKVQDKLIFGNSVRQVLDYLRRGEIDCGLIYGTDVLKAGSQVQTIAELRAIQVLYPAAMVKANRDPEGAALFLGYLATAEAQAIIQGHGFSLP